MDRHLPAELCMSLQNRAEQRSSPFGIARFQEQPILPDRLRAARSPSRYRQNEELHRATDGKEWKGRGPEARAFRQLWDEQTRPKRVGRRWRKDPGRRRASGRREESARTFPGRLPPDDETPARKMIRGSGFGPEGAVQFARRVGIW